MSGVLLMSIGFLLASFGKSGLHPLLTQGFLAGMGMSLLYFPVLALAPEYFTNYRATTIGFILAGARAGSLFLSSLLRTILFPLLRTLLTTLGGRWSLRIYALLAVANTTNAVARIITGYRRKRLNANAPKDSEDLSKVLHID
ncbi:hypothetical protein B0T18DRAFT_425927 [Schizothecium vesticola]|uniref:Major facilitator superfamily (MFS) profile domain-containing protein n=1 Tax=Schizothecium vesticola TaxID=314040 RepID=A0AA40F598_9PEZI|nr:hypothetical protein B0T18DRAFT_425927 [Schizothecium vesticola]